MMMMMMNASLFVVGGDLYDVAALLSASVIVLLRRSVA
jgi:hypothetical protein